MGSRGCIQGGERRKAARMTNSVNKETTDRTFFFDKLRDINFIFMPY
jgi:hypothetical protein